jgi:hypothetical protein
MRGSCEVFRISIPWWCGLVGLALSLSADAQVLLSNADAQKVAPLFESHTNPLKCTITEWNPSLDFAFRFDSGYGVHCRLGLFEGKKANILIYARITPAGKPPVWLGEGFRLAEMAPDTSGVKDPKRLKSEMRMSGAFGVGEGDYLVEILATDDHNRACYRRWNIHVAANRSQRNVPFAIQPLTAEPLIRKWDIVPPERGAGIRLTVLLDAAPIYPNSSRLRAWDRAFLLESLYSLIRQTPCKSVRVVAFNLEQQREVFRHDAFDASAFNELAHSLRNLETATVSVHALKKRNSPQFLIDLASQELAAAEPADAVVFLGPNTRKDAGISAGVLSRKSGGPPFFYFEYYPWPGSNFPDAIQQLTNAVAGKTFLIHSPADLVQAIQKMLAQLKQE